MTTTTDKKGFTLIELLLVVAIIGLVGSLAMVGQRHEQKKRRDVTRVSNTTELQKALALYASATGGYPTLDGCINGSDAVTTALRSGGFIAPDTALVDPLNPSTPPTCYLYQGGGATYTLNYTLETTSSAGEEGLHTIVP